MSGDCVEKFSVDNSREQGRVDFREEEVKYFPYKLY